jgi:IclR family acetate operon transcriptional repressor
MIKQESPYIIASVDRALKLLLMLEANSQDMGVTEISKMLKVQKSTAHSLLQTLLFRGFVQQNDNGRYTLGVRLIQLGAVCEERLDIRTLANPIMTELAEETNEIALLAVLSDDELIIVKKVEPQRPFLVIPKFNFSIALHSTSVGKVLLAHASEEIRNIITARGFERYTQYTINNVELLHDELAKVKKQGYAIGCNETIDGITCIGVPVYGNNSSVIAAISISSASSRLTPDKYSHVIKILKQKSQAISQRLGHY